MKDLLDKIPQARKTNLPQYLMSRGEKLKRTGRRYKHAEHDSLVFTNNAYYWNSRNEKGNAIDFLMSFYGMSFEAAVEDLTAATPIGAAVEKQIKKTDPPTFSFSNITINRDMRRAIAYLRKTRGIDYDIIKKLIDEKYIYQESGTNNIVFPMYDENRKPVGAELVGTLSDVRYKGVKEGSKYGYGFNIAIDKPLKYALFFESAIDLISFMEIKQAEGKPLTGCLLVSMAGVKENIIEHTIKAFSGDSAPLEAVLCVDNDLAGANFTELIKAQNNSVRTLLAAPPCKDWNEQLKYK